MSLLLADTSFLIDSERTSTNLDTLIGDEDDLAIAAITLAELLVGVELATGRRRHRRRAYVEDIVEVLPVIAYDAGVAVEHAVLLASVREAGRPRGAHDLLIAATARATGRSIVTSDRGAFANLPGVSVRDSERPDED